jgi:hypothetical protein
MDVTLCIEDLRARLERHRRGDLKEAPTRRIFVETLLQALGWDVTDPDEVELEWPTIDGKSVDYALKIDSKPVLLVEAKALNDALRDVKSVTQVVNYAANANVRWCILTNGVTYKVYDSYEKAEAPEKLVFEVSIDAEEDRGTPDQQIMERLSLLSPDSLARRVLDQIAREAFTMGKIRKALDRIFVDPPSSLVRLVRSTIGDDAIKPAEVRKALGELWPRAPELGTTVSSLSTVPIRIKEERSPKYYSAPADRVPRQGILEVDTVVVPAREDGFKEVFLGENRWYEIRIHHSVIPRIKYIAAYQVAPVSAITHWAPVKNIEPWQGSGKFVVNFAKPAKEIEPIPLVPKSRVKGLQNIRYTSFDKLQRAKTLDEVF